MGESCGVHDLVLQYIVAVLFFTWSKVNVLYSTMNIFEMK